MLTPEQYRVLRDHGTERAGTSPLDGGKSERVNSRAQDAGRNCRLRCQIRFRHGMAELLRTLAKGRGHIGR